MRLRRSRILRTWGDFQQVREEGKSYGGKHIVLGLLHGAEEIPSRFGFITSKRVGNAVTRNKVRRRLRAIATELGDDLPCGYKVVTIARYKAAEADFQVLRNEWQQLAQRAGVLSKKSDISKEVGE